MNLLRFVDRAPMRGRLLTSVLFTAVFAGCMPPTPHIDGSPGAPAAPSTPWRVPASARTPPPAKPPHAPEIDSALRADSLQIASVTALSMTDVIDLALRNNPATRESWATARAAADQYGSALGALYPTINGTINLNRTSSTATSSFNGTGTNAGTGNPTGGLDSNATRGSGDASAARTIRTQLTPAISFSYLVFDFGGRAGTIESARQQAIASGLAHNLTIQNVVLQTEASLFSYLATRALRDAQVTAVREAQADTAASEARLRVGVGTLEEVLQTRTALAQAKLQLATLEGNLLASRANLAASIGLPANSRFDVPEIATTDSVASIGASVDTLINRAIVERPDLAQVRAQAAALAAQIRIARSAGYPALTISSTTSFPQQIGGTTNLSSGRTFSVVLGLQVPIFNGFSREYDVKSAREQYEAGLARVRSASQQITVQVFTSYAALQTAAARVTAAVDLLAAAQQSSDVAIGRYREGVGTIVDVLLARSALASARASEIQARWEWRTALAQLGHDVGVLDTGGRPNIPLNP